MTATFDGKAYNRAFAQYCLQMQKSPSTAAEIAEHMLTIAQSEGLPQEVLAETRPSTVYGALRALENDGIAARVGGRKNGRNGREEPTWDFTGEERQPVLPHPADFTTDEQPPVGDALGGSLGLTPEMLDGRSQTEVLAMLRVSEDVGAALVRFFRDLDEIRTRFAVTLQTHRDRQP